MGCGMRRGSYAGREQVRERLRERCGAEARSSPIVAEERKKADSPKKKKTTYR